VGATAERSVNLPLATEEAIPKAAQQETDAEQLLVLIVGGQCDRTAQVNSILLPKPLLLAIKQ
jgi:hypothetical protein